MGVGGSLKLYAEMMRSLDEGVGRVMNAVKAAGIESRYFGDLHQRQWRRAILLSMAFFRDPRVTCWKVAFVCRRLFAGPALFRPIE